MTIDAIAGDIGMIEVGRQPGHCGVAIVTIVAAGYMICILAGCRRAVVTRSAAADHLRVVDSHHRRKACRAVTIFANITGLYVCRTLADATGSVVAAHAITDNTDMIESCRYPCSRVVTGIALIVRGNVSRDFTGGLYAVVATHATSGKRRVVDVRHDAPARRNMAVRTFADRRNVVSRLRRGAYEAALRMATGTCGIRRAERATDVTGFAADVGMAAVEDKSGAEVIEILLCFGIAGAKQTRGKYAQQQKSCQVSRSGCLMLMFQFGLHHRNDLTSLNESAVWHRPQSGPNSPSWTSSARWQLR